MSYLDPLFHVERLISRANSRKLRSQTNSTRYFPHYIAKNESPQINRNKGQRTIRSLRILYEDQKPETVLHFLRFQL